MNQENILLELNRMREIMGIPHLNESKKRNISETYFREKGLLLERQAADEVEEMIVKEFGAEDLFKRATAGDAYDNAIKNFTETLEKEGLTPARIRQQLEALYSNKYKNTPPTIEEITAAAKLYLKNNPDVLLRIGKEIPEINKQAMESIKLDDVIPDEITRQAIDDAIKLKPENLTSQQSKDAIDAVIVQLETDFPITSRPQTVQDLIDGLKDQRKLADDITGNGETIASRIVDPGTEADVLIKQELQTGKTQAEIDAENATRQAEIDAKNAEEAKLKKQQDAEQQYQAMKDEKIEDVMARLKGTDEYENAVSWLARLLNITPKKIKQLLERVEKDLSGMTIEQLDNIKSTKVWEDAVSELGQKSRKKVTTKDVEKKLSFGTRLLNKVCGAHIVTRSFCGVITIAIIFWLRDNWGLAERQASRLGMIAYDYILDKIPTVTDAEDNPDFCFATVTGYYGYDQDDRWKIKAILKDNKYSCDNIGGDAEKEIQKIVKYNKKANSLTIIVNGDEITIKGSGNASETTASKFKNDKDGFIAWFNIMRDQGQIKNAYSSTNGYWWEEHAWFGDTPLKYKNETEGWEIPADGKP